MSKNKIATLNVSEILNFVLFIVALFDIIFFYFNLVNYINALSIIILIIVLYVSLKFSKLLNGFIKGFFIFFIYTIILNYLIRFLSLSIWPYDFGGILGTEDSYIKIPTSTELVTSIYFLIFFIAEVFVVLIVVNKLFKGQEKTFLKFSNLLYNNYKIIFNFLILILSLQILFSILFDWKMGSAAWKFGWLNRILPLTYTFFLFIFIQICYWGKLPTKYKVLSFVIYVLYVVSGLLVGSRSAIFNLLSSYFIVLLIIKPGLRFNRNKLLIYFCLSLILGFCIWVLGTAIRSSNSINSSELSTIGVLIEVIQRLSAACDSFIAISNNWNNCMNSASLHSVMSFQNILPQFINTLTPGKIFNIDELYVPAVYFREGVFGFDNFISNGDVWSGFGWFLVEYGYWGILVFPVFLLVHFVVFRFLLLLKDIFFYVSFFYFNWISYDFILHGSFIVSGFYGLINSIVFSFFFFILFRFKLRH